ncbi:MAG: hypothetical protein F2667_14190 [Actinobacteria bacterium]|uniref:Unannotated protein n=1 Tax=freshwater metagenome TaxID=449393 RepID=A0A6J6SE38_9ZZZZ|nr:hypothetical protein [Actinomycetota bacterium]
MQIHATARALDDQTTEHPHRWTVDAPDYNTGMTEVRAGVPDGWILLHVLTEH